MPWSRRALTALALLAALTAGAAARAELVPGDADGSGAVNAIDLQVVIRAVLGLPLSGQPDVNYDGETNALDMQITIRSILGQPVEVTTTPPALRGLRQDALASQLAEHGLLLGEVSVAYDEVVPEGLAISQDLAPGAQAPMNTRVDVVVSLGPPLNTWTRKLEDGWVHDLKVKGSDGYLVAWGYKETVLAGLDQNGANVSRVSRVWEAAYDDAEITLYDGVISEERGLVVAGLKGKRWDPRFSVFLGGIDRDGAVTIEASFPEEGYSSIGKAVCLTNDGGYAVAADRHFGSVSPENPVDWRLYKTDAQGDVEYALTLGGSERDYVHDIVATQDGGVVLIGQSQSFGPSMDVYAVKVDAGGSVAWEGVYGGPQAEKVYQVVPTDDGGFAFCGRVARGPWQWGNPSSVDPYVGRIDAAGNLLWERVIDEEGEGAELYAITVTHDGGFLAAGFWQLGEGDVRGFYLARFDEMGNLLWTRTDLDVDVPWRARAVSPTDDGGFVIVSEAYSENFIRKIDALGYAEPYEGD